MVRIRRIYRRFIKWFEGSRVVIIEQGGKFRASFQGKRWGLIWREAHTSPEYQHFSALLMDLSDRQARVQSLKGQPISRQARRAFGRKVASRV